MVDKVKKKKPTHVKSQSLATEEEFAFNPQSDPVLESQLVNFMNNYDELITGMKISISNSKISKNNSDPKTKKRVKSERKNSKKKKTKSMNLNSDTDDDKKEEEIQQFVTQVDEKADIKNLTSIEEIKDFYEYTENCLKMIKDLGPPPDEEELANHSVELPEKLTNKKLAVFDLDETLIHCELKNIEKADMPITVTLNNKKIRVIFYFRLV